MDTTQPQPVVQRSTDGERIAVPVFALYTRRYVDLAGVSHYEPVAVANSSEAAAAWLDNGRLADGSSTVLLDQVARLRLQSAWPQVGQKPNKT